MGNADLLYLTQRLPRAEARRWLARDSASAARARLSGHRLSGQKEAQKVWTLEALAEADVSVVSQLPERLLDIPDAPLLLYARGEPDCLYKPGVAVVGARRCSAQGRELAQMLGCALAQAGFLVVSGLAAGIDAAAHRGALASGRPGATAALLGHGHGQIYPAANAALAADILRCGGLLLSEYPPHLSPARWRFPERNRLISGLSGAVVLIEASARSGSLITARLALEQGRDVLVVPGAAGDPRFAGSHRLLRQGAALVESAADVFDELGCERATARPESRPSLSPELDAVYQAVDVASRTLDQISEAAGLPVAAAGAALLQLELEGFVRQLHDGYIRLPLR